MTQQEINAKVVDVLKMMVDQHLQSDKRMSKLEETTADMGERVSALEETTTVMSNLLIKVTEMALEMQRENRQTRSIWIAIARKQELFSDEDLEDLFRDDQD